MVSMQAIPAIVSASITIYVGIYHLLISVRRVHRRQDISFAVACLAMGMYASFAAGLYCVADPTAGAPWQRGQMLALSLVGVSFLWFVSDYTQHVSTRALWSLTGFFALFTITMLYGETELIFRMDNPSVRHIELLGLKATYCEMGFGPIVFLQTAVGMLAFIYVLLVARRLYLSGRRAKARPLLAATLLFFVGAANDSYVGAGVYTFFYIMEYTYAGMVFLMAISMSHELGEVSRTRASLSQLEHRFAAFFYNTAIGLVLTTDDGEILMANPGLCKMFGVGDPDDLVGDPILDHFHAEDRMALHTMSQSIVREEVSSCRTEKRYVWPDRQVYWGDISIAAVPTETISSAGLIWMVVGITERRRAVESLRLLNEQLEDKIRQRTTSLRESNRQLEASLTRLQQDEEAGKRIQLSMLPPGSVRVGDYSFAHYLISSLTMCGDFLDYYRIDETHLGFYVADVSGHGVSSALVTVLLKSFVGHHLDRFHASGDPTVLDPQALVSQLNTELLQDKLEKHMTMFYGVIDTATSTLTFSNAGQFPFPILVENGSTRRLRLKGTPVGMFATSTYTNTTVDLPASCSMVIFSDGVLEILPPANLLDKQHYLDTLVSTTGGRVDRMVTQLGVDDVKHPPDDMTILSIRRDSV